MGVDQTNTIKYYSIAPYTHTIGTDNEEEDIDHSNEIDFQYSVDVDRMRSKAEEFQVLLEHATSFRTLSLPPGSYLRLAESPLKVPFGALVEATGISKDHGKLCPRQLKVAHADSKTAVREDILAMLEKIPNRHQKQRENQRRPRNSRSSKKERQRNRELKQPRRTTRPPLNHRQTG